MKKIFLIVSISFLIVGCAALRQAKDDMYSCLNDQVCMDAAVAKAESAKKQITAVAGVASPIPWVPSAAGALGGGIVLLVSLVTGGRKKREAGK